MLAVIDGNVGLRRAVGEIWPRAAVQRCCVHKLRNLERKAPKHALPAIRDDFHRIVYAANADAARVACTAFERTWTKRCPGVATSLREGGDELLTFFTFPKSQWETLRTTNTMASGSLMSALLNDLCSLGQAPFWEESFDKLPFAANKEVRERFKPLTWRGLWIPIKPGAKIHQFIV